MTTAKYVVVENAGYEGERDVKTFLTLFKADYWLTTHYQEDEIETLHVAIRRDREDGREYV